MCIQSKIYAKIDRMIVGSFSAFCAIILILMFVLGPLMTNTIQYKTSQSGIYLIMGTDLSNVFFLFPLCLIGGILLLLNHPKAKFLLVLSSLTLIYTGLSYGIGMEWNHPDLQGSYNVQDYFWMYVLLIIGGNIKFDLQSKRFKINHYS